MSKRKNILFSRGAAILHDLLMIPTAWGLAYWFRFNLEAVPWEFLQPALTYLWIVIPVQAVVYQLFGLYRGVWRFASLPDLLRILKGTGVGLVVSVAVIFSVYRLEAVPRSVPVLYGLLLVILLSGPRFLYRWLKDHRISLASGKRVLIVGAGQAGEMLVRDLLRDHSNAYLPVAFVDDKPRRLGQDIHGIPVVGATGAIPEVVEERNIDVVVFAIPSAKVKERRRLMELCEQAGVPVRTIPQLDDLMSGQVAINQLREVSIEDLLGREPVTLDWQAIREGLSQRTILVTGAGGSIGSELCRQIARLEPAKLVLMDNGEFNLYTIELELRNQYPNLGIETCICDVRDATATDRVFESFRPQLVFHAAAFKHVPLLEHQVREAVYNNVLGTRNVAEVADRYGTAEFVLISTDKAVNPANVMGATKRLAEIFCQNFNAKSETRFITVRFGNVLGSAGSVVPLFRNQIAKGGPVTVTHTDIERYFMTIPEASQLIMQAGVLGKGGEIFVLDMGKPVRINYLAEQMIRLSGKIPGEDIEIIYTGLRPGEKLYEELFHAQEELQSTHHEKILLAKYRAVDWGELSRRFDDIQQAVARHDEKFLFNVLCEFVPEHRMQQQHFQDERDAAS
jgi:FlaA1/EpsC-like NDP-sugar epimerase